jgi:hypothetical protein
VILNATLGTTSRKIRQKNVRQKNKKIAFLSDASDLILYTAALEQTRLGRFELRSLRNDRIA